MSATLDRVREFVARREYLVTQHGARELLRRDIHLDALIASLSEAVVVEDYPDAWKGPSVLVLQHAQEGRLVHAVWGLEIETRGPAVLITAYWPDKTRWTADFLTRRRS